MFRNIKNQINVFISLNTSVIEQIWPWHVDSLTSKTLYRCFNLQLIPFTESRNNTPIWSEERKPDLCGSKNSFIVYI